MGKINGVTVIKLRGSKRVQRIANTATPKVYRPETKTIDKVKVHNKKKIQPGNLKDNSTTCYTSLKHPKKIIQKNKYECEQCEHSTNVLRDLTRHIETVHDLVKKHECQQCDYATNQPGNLD